MNHQDLQIGLQRKYQRQKSHQMEQHQPKFQQLPQHQQQQIIQHHQILQNQQIIHHQQQQMIYQQQILQNQQLQYQFNMAQKKQSPQRITSNINQTNPNQPALTNMNVSLQRAPDQNINYLHYQNNNLTQHHQQQSTPFALSEHHISTVAQQQRAINTLQTAPNIIRFNEINEYHQNTMNPPRSTPIILKQFDALCALDRGFLKSNCSKLSLFLKYSVALYLFALCILSYISRILLT